MDGRPLLAAESPADSTLPPPPSPDPAPVDDDIKNTQEADGCKNGAEPTNKTADVACPVKKVVRKAGSRRWVLSSLFGGRLGTEAGAGDASSSGGKGAAARVPVLSSAGSGLDARKKEIVVDIYKESSSTLATTASGVVEAEAGAGDGSSSGEKGAAARVPVLSSDARNSHHVVDIPSSSSSPPTTAPRPAGAEETGGNISTLINRAEQFAGVWKSHVTLADPSANLTEALRKFAASDNMETAASLDDAAATLDKIAASGKIGEQAAEMAKNLSSQASALAASHGRGADPPISRSPEILFYIAIPGSVGLLPYLNTIIPKHLHVVVAAFFGTAFSGATLGALLIAWTRNKSSMKTATILGALSFTAFSLLVIVFVSFALAGGSLILMCILAALVVGLHIYGWAWK